MICRTCIRAASRQTSRLPLRGEFTLPSTAGQAQRYISSSSSNQNAAPAPGAAAAPSPSAPTPAPAPTTPNPTSNTTAPAAASSKPKPHPLVKSSVPAGTPLKGLNFLKNAQDPVALEDHEYPAWLWEILGNKEKKAGADAMAGDLFSKSKKQRRLAAKRLRKEQLANPDAFARKVPLTEQTVDLPAGDGTVEGNLRAAEERERLTKALRDKRRKAIKEGNFLKAMG